MASLIVIHAMTMGVDYKSSPVDMLYIPWAEDQFCLEMDEKTSAYMYYFWACSFVIFIIGFINLFILIAIIQALGLSLHGLNTMQFLPNQLGIKFTDDLIANNITTGNGIISSFSDEPLYIHANDELKFRTTKDGASLFLNEDEGLKIESIQFLKVQDPESKKIIFDSQSPILTWEDSVENLHINELTLDSISSPLWKDLFIQSDSTIDILGAEGISIESKNIKMEAGEHIIFSSDSKIVIDAEDIRLDPLALPVGGDGGYPGENPHFKICICLPSGLVYTIPENVSGTPIHCDDDNYSPCHH
ncbi:uncharacterized protein Scgbeta isoform X1 [Lepeophtheirus salmonis]|nr:uncharacterized protein LOC121118295 isoform X1 [Lepeophtheirus salmonis]XP_040568797.1 uncharacterized protein LOC121118295 isoform X1 [Lepeophtheirus salmonis]